MEEEGKRGRDRIKEEGFGGGGAEPEKKCWEIGGQFFQIVILTLIYCFENFTCDFTLYETMLYLRIQEIEKRFRIL